MNSKIFSLSLKKGSNIFPEIVSPKGVKSNEMRVKNNETAGKN